MSEQTLSDRVIVPREPTEAMIEAGSRFIDEYFGKCQWDAVTEVWDAFIAAAPPRTGEPVAWRYCVEREAMTDDAIILAMCKAHDAEEAAAIGEPSPWREDFDRDPDWEQARFLAMREAFDVCRAAHPRTGEPVAWRYCVEQKDRPVRWEITQREVTLAEMPELVVGARWVVQPLFAHPAPEQGWRFDMENAPTDGTPALVYWPKMAVNDDGDLTGERLTAPGHVGISYRESPRHGWEPDQTVEANGTYFDDDFEFGEPVAWMPLHAPPQPEQGAE